MRSASLLALLCAQVALVFAHTAGAAPTQFTCFYDPKKYAYTIAPGHGTGPNAVAYSTWDDQIGESGYAQLYLQLAREQKQKKLTNNPDYAVDEVTSIEWRCMGLVEGYTTSEKIADLWRNFVGSELRLQNETVQKGLDEFVADTMTWTQKGAERYAKESKYWSHVSDMMWQLTGLQEGFAAAPDSTKSGVTLSLAQFFLMNMIGDLDDLLPALKHAHIKREARKRGETVPDIDVSDNRVQEVILDSHCSAIVKPTPDGKDLFAAHEMWASYWQMLNVYKHYEFGPVPMHFSSYPGFLSSEDDFYQVGGPNGNLLVMETTNGVFNMSLYDRLTPKSLMSWIRVMVSNRMATSGEEWVNTMKRYNSGTYNNQWMVVDMKKFDPENPKIGANGKPQLQAGTLWIGSQLPGFWEQADVTDVINTQGYWPSYNIPYFKTVFDLAGYQEMVKKQPELWTHDHCPRANIMRRQEGMVVDVPNLMDFMRYNEWQSDPLSLQCPLNQIASRLDLSPPNYTTVMPYCAPQAFGAINAKLTTHNIQANYQAWVIAGPTHEFERPFQWDAKVESQFPNAVHFGQPDIFGSYWMNVRPLDAKQTHFVPSKYTTAKK